MIALNIRMDTIHHKDIFVINKIIAVNYYNQHNIKK